MTFDITLDWQETTVKEGYHYTEYIVAGTSTAYVVRQWYFSRSGEYDWEVWTENGRRCVVDTQTQNKCVDAWQVAAAIDKAERDFTDTYYEPDFDAERKQRIEDALTEHNVPW